MNYLNLEVYNTLGYDWKYQRQGNTLTHIINNDYTIIVMPSGPIMQSVKGIILKEKSDGNIVCFNNFNNNSASEVQTGSIISQIEQLDCSNNLQANGSYPIVVTRNTTTLNFIELRDINKIYNHTNYLEPTMSRIHQYKYNKALLQHMSCNPFSYGDIGLIDIKGNLNIYSVLSDCSKCIYFNIEKERNFQNWEWIGRHEAIVCTDKDVYIYDARLPFNKSTLSLIRTYELSADTLCNIKCLPNNNMQYIQSTINHLFINDIRMNSNSSIAGWARKRRLVPDTYNVPFYGILEYTEIEGKNEKPTCLIFESEPLKQYTTLYSFQNSDYTNKSMHTYAIFKNLRSLNNFEICVSQNIEESSPERIYLNDKRKDVRIIGLTAIRAINTPKTTMYLFHHSSLGEICHHKISRKEKSNAENIIASSKSVNKISISSYMNKTDSLPSSALVDEGSHDSIEPHEHINALKLVEKIVTSNKETVVYRNLNDFGIYLINKLESYFSKAYEGTLYSIAKHVNKGRKNLSEEITPKILFEYFSKRKDEYIINSVYCNAPVSSLHVAYITSDQNKDNEIVEHPWSTYEMSLSDYQRKFKSLCECSPENNMLYPCKAGDCILSSFILVSKEHWEASTICDGSPLQIQKELIENLFACYDDPIAIFEN